MRDQLGVDDVIHNFEIIMNGIISSELKLSAQSFIENNIRERVITSLCGKVDSLI
jgi:hypothetical protein